MTPKRRSVFSLIFIDNYISLCLSFYLFIYLFIYSFIFLFIYSFIYLFIHLLFLHKAVIASEIVRLTTVLAAKLPQNVQKIIVAKRQNVRTAVR